MGGEQFEDAAHGVGLTPEKAFSDLVEKAQYDYGYSGYTGTIAEKAKLGFQVVGVAGTIEDYREFLRSVCDAMGPPYEDGDDTLAAVRDKWGPAACVEFEGEALGAYLAREKIAPEDGIRVFAFFGSASA